MFDNVVFQAEIHKVGIQVTDKTGVVRRLCKITFAREFDPLVASNLGTAAKNILKALVEHDAKSAVIPLDRVVGSCLLQGLNDQVKIPSLRGIKAKCKAGKKDEDPPSVLLSFDFDFAEDAWLFLGRNCLAYAKVTLTPSQQVLQFPGRGLGELS